MTKTGPRKGDTEKIVDLLHDGHTPEEVSDMLNIKQSAVERVAGTSTVDQVAVQRALNGDRDIYKALNAAELRVFASELGRLWRNATLGERELLLARGMQLGEDRNQYQQRAEKAAELVV